MPRRTLRFAALACASALLAFCAFPADANRNGIRWLDCAPLGRFNMTFPIDHPAPYFVVSTVAPPGMTRVVGFDAWLTLSVGAPTMPPFWQSWPGGCSDGGMVARFDVGSPWTSCVDPWGGEMEGSLTITPEPGFGPNTVTLWIHGSLPEGSEVAFDPSTEYALCAVSAPAAFASQCAGAMAPGCIVLQSLCLRQSDGTGHCQGYHEVGTPWCLWQDPLGQYRGCMLPVPAARTTWGAIKMLYR